MRKLHVKQAGQWLPVFCHQAGKVITCQDAPKKALPSLAMWADADLAFFRQKFSNHEFCLKVPT